MMRKVGPFLVLLLSSCKGPVVANAAADVQDDARKNWEGHSNYRGCRLKPETDCGSEHLPRITEKEWTLALFDQMLKRSAQGTVAVDQSAGSTRMVPNCRLPGSYAEARGEPGSGRFWGTDRVIFKVDELGPECQTATHGVAAFAVHDLDGSRRFSAVLAPLPCPPTSDPAPAKGCLGRGLTGPKRKERALDMMHKATPDEAYKQDLTFLFEVYALWPDDRRSLEYLHRMDQKPKVDAFVAGQVRAALSYDPPANWPRFDLRDDKESGWYPPFLSCFPGLFDPMPGQHACWRPAAP